jgi:hypothetical protein
MRLPLCAAVIGSLLTQTLPAQETTGSLRGRVVMPSGEPARGVESIISGSHLLAARKVSTDNDGALQVLALPPGIYSVRLSRMGARPVLMDNVSVTLGQTTSLPTVSLEESPIQLEPVHVAPARQLIDASHTDVGGTLTAVDYARLPGDRDYRSMISILPHANQSNRGDAINVAGATGLENMYYIDGVNVTSPLKAETGTGLPYNFVRAVEVKTGGYQAQYGNALGGLVNAVTYSGTNAFEANVFAYSTNSSFSARPKAQPTLRESRAVSYDVGLRLSGPILRDRLWYSAAYNERVDRVAREIQGQGEFMDRTTAQFSAAKLTWQAASALEIQLSAFGDPLTRHSVATPAIPSGLTVLNPDPYLTRQARGGWVRTLHAARTFGDRGLLELSLSRSDARQKVDPETEFARTTPRLLDLYSRTISGGIVAIENSVLQRSAATLRGTLSQGSHTITLGGEFEDLVTNRETHTSAGFQIQRNGLGRFLTISEHTAGEFHNRVPISYLQDSWRANDRLTLNLGIRWSSQNLSGANGKIAQRFSNEWQPRVGFIRQLGASRASAVFGSVARIYQELPLNLSSIFYGDLTALRSFYSADPRLAGSVPDSVLDDSRRASDVRQSIPDLQAEHFDEATLGYERLFGKASKATARLIRRELKSTFQWGFGPQGIVFGTPGTGDFAFLPKPVRRYTALELAVVGEKHRVAYRSSYVLSRNWGNFTGFYEPDFGFANPGGNAGFIAPHQAVNSEGLLPNDRTHLFKFSGGTQRSSGLNAGITVSWESGSPLNEFAPSPTQGLAIQRAFVVQRGTAGRTPALWDASARFAYSIGGMNRADSRFILDLLHLGNAQKAVWVDELKYLANVNGTFSRPNPNYGVPIAFQRPRMVRLGWEANLGRRG